MMSRRMVVGLALAVLVLAADQGSKYWVLHGLDLAARGDIHVLPPLLDFTMVWNNGVTFGLLRAWHRAGQLLLSGVAVAVVAGLLAWLRRAETMLVASSIGAIAGGALGNVADRFRLGVVVDFIHVHWGGWDPFPFVFNVGDSAIVIGVGLLLLESVLPARFRGRGSLQAPPPKA